MKRIFAILLVMLLLTGCNSAPKPTTSATTAGETEPTVSLYAPGSDVEELTGGAVRAYPMTDHTVQGFRFIGQDMVLFTQDEHVELTTLLLLRGENLGVLKSVTLDGALYPEDPHLCIGESAIAYYNGAENSLVFLDAALKETRRIQLPDDVSDTPILNAAMDTLYYCAGNEIYALDLESGISRLLKQHACQTQNLVGLHFGDSVLEVFVTDDNGNGRVDFVSTENGRTIGSDDGLMSFVSEGKRYLLRRTDATVTETLVGTQDGEIKALRIPGATVYAQGFGINAVLAGSEDQIAVYDLGSGKVTSRIALGEEVRITSAAADPSGNYVWILGYDTALEADVLYRWDIVATEVSENTVHLHQRYTAEAPDTDGIAQCQKKADSVGETYGLHVLVGNELPEPEGYTFVYEHQVEAFEVGLEKLGALFSRYPENFFRELGSVSKSGIVHIGLVRDIRDITGAPVPDVTGMHYILNGDHYIAIVIGPEQDAAVHHQLAHVLDSKVYSVSKAYDLWEDLNPEGFVYLSSYQAEAPDQDDPNLQGETQAFVDAYAMTFAKEDRARLFEFAMGEGNETLFAAPIIQEKLKQLCLGIREAYGWTKTEITLPWEQYLAQE